MTYTEMFWLILIVIAIGYTWAKEETYDEITAPQHVDGLYADCPPGPRTGHGED